MNGQTEGSVQRMPAYIGSKIILAMPMDYHTFLKEHRPDQPLGENQEGYMVVYPNPDGLPYHSWSPKIEFEIAYRRVTTEERALIL